MKPRVILLPLLCLSFLSACTSPQKGSQPIPSSEDTSVLSSDTSAEDTSIATSENTSVSSSEDSSPSGPMEYARDPRDESQAANQTWLDYIGGIDDAWEHYRGDGVTIAVIDTDFDCSHSEFKNEDGSSKISPLSASFSASGTKVTTTVGPNWTYGGESHGTFCAAMAAASCTGQGTVGVAPNAGLMLLKTDARPLSICEAFRYAADNGARVITISIGSYADGGGDLDRQGADLTTVFNDSVAYAYNKGVVVCSAAGNGGLESRPTEYTYPGATPLVIGCAGLADASRNSLWSGTSYNSSSSYQFCDVFAPAENMYNACSYVDQGTKYLYDGGWNGTSFASPQVAGAAALYFQKNPTATNADFERDLYASCDKVDPAANTGHGALNIARLLGVEQKQKIIYFQDASWWRSDSARSSLFAWNQAGTVGNADYPGVVMTKVSTGLWRATIDGSRFDYMMFVRVGASSMEDWGAKTVDIPVCSFSSKRNLYTISSTSAAWTSQGKLVQGNFSHYAG